MFCDALWISSEQQFFLDTLVERGHFGRLIEVLAKWELLKLAHCLQFNGLFWNAGDSCACERSIEDALKNMMHMLPTNTR